MPLLSTLKRLEETRFAHLLDPTDATRLKSDEYAWLYRPSHHAKTGLVTEADLTKKILSVGAYPAYFEELLIEAGAAQQNILVADSDERIDSVSLPHVHFDMTCEWPDVGMFDLIIFPESLCIALADKMEEEGIVADPHNPAATDQREAELLAGVIKQALDHLKPKGVIRANGPMSHPNVVARMSDILENNGYAHDVAYNRFLMSIIAK